MRCTPWVMAALLLAACAPKPETPEQQAARLKAESDSARVAIEASNARFAQFVMAGEPDSAAANYAEDAILYPDHAPAVRGRAAIAKWFSEGLAGITVTSDVVTTTSVEASGPIAIETGLNAVRVVPKTPAGAGPVTDTVHYLTTWRKIDGRWLITHDIASSIMPVQPTPAKRR